MRLLLDQNISFLIINRISDLYPEAKQVRQLNLENASDIEIWNFAKENGYIIVTFDSDFYDLSLVWGAPPKIIWIRTGNLTTNQIENVFKRHNKAILDFVADTSLDCLKIIENVP